VLAAAIGTEQAIVAGGLRVEGRKRPAQWWMAAAICSWVVTVIAGALWLRRNDWLAFGLALVALITAVLQSVAWYRLSGKVNK